MLPGGLQGTIARNLLPLTRLLPPRPRRASVWCTAFKDMNLVVIDDGPWNLPCGRRYGSSTADRFRPGHPYDL